MDYCCADIVALEREGDRGGGQSQKNLGSRVALLPGKFLQIRKVFAVSSLLAG